MPRVCLDAGHGGADPGAVGPGGELEKDINMAAVRYVRQYLVRAGCEVVLTRDSDVEVNLATRVSVANASKADVFLSVHTNVAVQPQNGSYSPNPVPRGLEAFHYSGSTRGRRFAETLVRAASAASGFPVRRLEPSGFYVVKNTLMPAVLLEIGFLSNETDRYLLREPAFLDKLSLGIAWGTVSYLRETGLLSWGDLHNS